MTKNRKNDTIFTDEELMEELRRYVPKGSTIFTRVEHVSQSGMSRRIVPLAIVGDDIVNLSWHLIKLNIADKPRGQYVEGSVHVGGCGMDMCFALAYDIGQTLYGDGYSVKKRSY